jgi:hypothetical protein
MYFYRSYITIFRSQPVAVESIVNLISKNKKIPDSICRSGFFFIEIYSGFGAPTGQTSAQLPQSMHLSASIT